MVRKSKNILYYKINSKSPLIICVQRGEIYNRYYIKLKKRNLLYSFLSFTHFSSSALPYHRPMWRRSIVRIFAHRYTYNCFFRYFLNTVTLNVSLPSIIKTILALPLFILVAFMLTLKISIFPFFIQKN